MNKELDNLIEQVLRQSGVSKRVIQEEGPPPQINTQATEKTRVLKIPKFALSNTWGDPDSEDRKTISMFMSKIPGTTIADKINSINNFISGCDASCIESKDVGEILSNLIVLDSLSGLISDYNPQTGGYLMESFLAGLLGGTKSRQVKGTGQIEDIYNYEGDPISVKFLLPSSSVKGSKNHLKDFFEKTNKPLRYLLIQKKQKGDNLLKLNFYTFTVGSEERKIPGDFDSTEVVKGFLSSEVESRGQEIATLNFGSKEHLKSIADKYIERLGERVLTIFDLLDSVVTNTNKYMITNDTEAGRTASANAADLKVQINEQF
tara:strand:- start:6536 stop:7492 length:957 start_codon:yes stop_codon:yes gene_type:complete